MASITSTNSTSYSFKYHIVFVLSPSWGHIQPSVPLLFRIVQERPDVVVSLLVIGEFKDGVDREIGRYCSGSNSVFRDNIRIIQLSDFRGHEMERWDNIMTLWPDCFRKLWACEPIACFSGQTYPSAPRPSLCVVDPLIISEYGANMAEEKKIRMLIWTAGGASHMMAMLAPFEYGGKNNMVHDAKELAEKRNISEEEAIVELLSNVSDKVRKIAGLPPAYDYEFTGEYTVEGATQHLRKVANTVRKLNQHCDGAVLANSPIIEKEAIEAFRRWWCDNVGKRAYVVGPTVISEQVKEINQHRLSREQEVRNFLDRIYQSHGEHTLLYMSFGTSIFPSGETPWQLIDIIVEMKIPLIFSMPHGDTFENQFPNDLRDKLQSSELILVAKWVPQVTILNHFVTGIFFTHGGQGSVNEALVAGVPLIVWPLQADQPYNSMHLTMNLNVAYQLFEVRINHGLLPLYQGIQPTGTKEAIDREFRQVLKDAFGEDGKVKRINVREISTKLKATWGENGEALSEMRRMLEENL